MASPWRRAGSRNRRPGDQPDATRQPGHTLARPGHHAAGGNPPRPRVWGAVGPHRRHPILCVSPRHGGAPAPRSRCHRGVRAARQVGGPGRCACLAICSSHVCAVPGRVRVRARRPPRRAARAAANPERTLRRRPGGLPQRNDLRPLACCQPEAQPVQASRAIVSCLRAGRPCSGAGSQDGGRPDHRGDTGVRRGRASA